MDPQPVFMNDFKLFCKELNKVFGDPNEKSTATRQLYALRQRGSATSYLAEFRRFSIVLDWDDAALAAQFYRGLKDTIKDELARTGKPDELEKLIDVAIRIDTHLFERSVEKGTSTVPSPRFSTPSPLFNRNTPAAYDQKPSVTPSPSEHFIRAAQTFQRTGRLTPDKYTYRMEKKLCLYCASDKHMVRHCPSALTRPNYAARTKPSNLRATTASSMAKNV